MKQIIINSIEEMKPYLKYLKKIKIWVCNTACGKSYLCSLDDRFFDLDAYRSQLHNSGIQDFDDRTIPKMWEIINSGKIILNAAHSHFLRYLEENDLPFVYMYGKPEVELEYIERMRHRGSSEDFIQRFGTVIASHYPSRANDKRGTYKIEMNPNEFVSDYAWNVFGMPKKYIKHHNFSSRQYKIVFIDVDGTLLNREHKLSEFTKNTIKLLRRQTKIILTTGRGPDSVLPILKELQLTDKDDYVICYNGGIILRGNEILEEHCISKSNIKLFLQKFDVNYLSYCCLRTFNKKIYIRDIDDIQKFIVENKIYKIMLSCEQLEIEKITSKLNIVISSHFNVFNSTQGLLEFVPKKVSKERAIQIISNRYHINPNNMIAIGDGKNDIGMFKQVECSIAVCNAGDNVKKCAKFVTDSNNDDGVAKALIKIFS